MNENKTTLLFILRQKLSNIPEKVYELSITNWDIIMTTQFSSLNIAIKNGKQPNNRYLQKIVEYTKEELSRTF